jgi:hypothetical protein
MELINVYFNEPNVEDGALNDVEEGYYCCKLVDHSKLRPFDVSTSFHPKVETLLDVVNDMEGWHDVGLLLVFPLMELDILQESAKTCGFSNYRCQEIVKHFDFVNEVLNLELFL